MQYTEVLCSYLKYIKAIKNGKKQFLSGNPRVQK